MSYVNTTNSVYRQTSHLEICLPKPVHCWPLNHHLVTQCLFSIWLSLIYVQILFSVVKYSEQKLFVYATSVQLSLCRKFCRKYRDRTICIAIFCTGSVMDKKSQKYVLAEEIFDDIGTQLANTQRGHIFCLFSVVWQKEELMLAQSC